MNEYAVCLVQRKDFAPILKQAREAGFSVKDDVEAGTVEILDGSVKVYSAICKGCDAWIVRYLKRYFA